MFTFTDSWSQNMEHMEKMTQEERDHWSESRESWFFYESMRVGQKWFKDSREVQTPRAIIYKHSPPDLGRYSRPDPTKPQEWYIHKCTFQYYPHNWRQRQPQTRSQRGSPSVRRSLSMSNSVDDASAWESPNSDDVNTNSVAVVSAVPRPREE